MRKRPVYTARLSVTLDGTGCKMCDLIRFRMADEVRYCNRTGEVLENWKTERGVWCPLEDIKERVIQDD